MKPSYFDQLEDELRDAVLRAGGGAADQRELPARAQPHRRRRWLSVPLLALNGLVVTAIAVALIVVLGHGHTAPTTPTNPATAPPNERIAGHAIEYGPGAVPTLRQLQANFAVLRRSQTSADRSWKPQCGCGSSATQLTQSTRLARRLPDGVRVFLDLERYRVNQADQRAGSVAMDYSLVEPNGNVVSVPYSSGSYDVYASATSGRDFISLAPDGVRTVTWYFSCQGTSSRCDGVRPFNVTVKVVGNVAARRLTRRTCPPPRSFSPRERRDHTPIVRRITACDTPMQTIWRNATGQIVASFPQGYGNLPAPPFVKGPQSTQTLAELSPGGVGTARIGDSAAPTVLTLDRLLGSRTVTRASVPGCPEEREIVWTSPAAASPLTIYTRGGRFVGYRYGAPVDQIGLVRGPGDVLTTTQGLNIGETVSQARHLYGNAFTARAVTSGSEAGRAGAWRTSTGKGSFGGAVLPSRYPVKAVAGADRIATITAGTTGCA